MSNEKELKRIALIIKAEKKVKIKSIRSSWVWDPTTKEHFYHPLRTKKYYLYLDKQRQIFEVIDANIISMKGNKCRIEYLQNKLEIEENKYE